MSRDGVLETVCGIASYNITPAATLSEQPGYPEPPAVPTSTTSAGAGNYYPLCYQIPNTTIQIGQLVLGSASDSENDFCKGNAKHFLGPGNTTTIYSIENVNNVFRTNETLWTFYQFSATWADDCTAYSARYIGDDGCISDLDTVVNSALNCKCH